MPTTGEKPPARDERAESLKTSFLVSRQLWRRAKIRAMDEGIELQELISKAIEMYLERKPKR
jgi:predicted DNA binding CopG/RHH family protein